MRRVSGFLGILLVGMLILANIFFCGAWMIGGVAIEFDPQPTAVVTPMPTPQPIPAQYIKLQFDTGSPWVAESFFYSDNNLWLTQVKNGNLYWHIPNYRVMTAEVSADKSVLLLSGLENEKVGREIDYLISPTHPQPWRAGQITTHVWWNQNTILYQLTYELVGPDYSTVAAWSPVFQPESWKQPFGYELIGFRPVEGTQQPTFRAYFDTFKLEVTYNPQTLGWDQVILQ